MDSDTIKITTQTTTINLDTSKRIIDMIDTIKNNSSSLESLKDYVLTIKDKSTSLVPLSREDLMEKDIITTTPHPYFSKIEKKKIEKKEVLDPLSFDNIIVFSPHPDDEILGISSLLHESFKAKKNIKVIYMTSGKSAGDPSVRQKEATNGIKIIGGSEENLIFMDMPFYLTKERVVSDNDYEEARNIFRKHKPSNVFICSDMFDPNQTHRKCWECLFKVLTEDKEFADIKVIFYYGIWYWPLEDEYTHVIPYDNNLYRLKVYAMLEHDSQIKTKFMGNDTRPFYQRAMNRDSKIGNKNGYDFCEMFYKFR